MREAVIRGAALCRDGARRGRRARLRDAFAASGAREDTAGLPLADFKALVREQFFMLLIDQEAALAAIPALLPAMRRAARKALAARSAQVLGARGASPPRKQNAAATRSPRCSIWTGGANGELPAMRRNCRSQGAVESEACQRAISAEERCHGMKDAGRRRDRCRRSIPAGRRMPSTIG